MRTKQIATVKCSMLAGALKSSDLKFSKSEKKVSGLQVQKNSIRKIAAIIISKEKASPQSFCLQTEI